MGQIRLLLPQRTLHSVPISDYYTLPTMKNSHAVVFVWACCRLLRLIMGLIATDRRIFLIEGGWLFDIAHVSLEIAGS